MPNSTFHLPERDVRWALSAVYWLQATWCVAAGSLLLFTPSRRFGVPYMFLMSTPGGHYLVGALYTIVGCVLVTAICSQRQQLMAAALLVGGTLGVVFGVFLLAGTIMGSTGVLAWLFAFYVGAHMLIQSAVLAHHTCP